MFRWAVCGLGRISHRWVKVANGIPDMKVIAAVSSSKSRAEDYKKRYEMDYALTYEELAKNPSIVDAVYVATNMSDHQKTVEMFLNAGIPVLCEKSFALNTKQTKSMIDTAKRKNVLLMEAMWCRVLPANRYIDQIMKEKKYGNIISASADFKAGWGHGPKSRVWKKDVGGGSVLDLAVYLVHYSQMLMGKPKRVIATGKIKNEVDISSDIIFEYNNNVKFDLHSSLQFPWISETFKIYCEKGNVIIPSFYGANKVIEKPFSGRKIIKRFDKIDGFSYEIAHFVELVRSKKKESYILPLSVTYEVMELLEEINRQLGVTF